MAFAGAPITSDLRPDLWIDQGGTFTDCVLRHPDGTVTTHKLLSSGVFRGLATFDSNSTVSDAILRIDIEAPSDNFFAGYHIKLIADGSPFFTALVKASTRLSRQITVSAPLPKQVLTRMTGHVPFEITANEDAPIVGMRWLSRAKLSDTPGPFKVRLGTTLATNALLERKGASTGFITTKGFGDLLEIGYQNRSNLFDLDIKKPELLQSISVEVDERISSDGTILKELSDPEIDGALKKVQQAGCESIAIALMNSYRNSIHEKKIAARAEALGIKWVSLSSAVAPLQRIVPRAETTVIDAYLNPVIHHWLSRLKEAAPSSSFDVMTSSGALVPADQFRGKDAILSGPAGGAIAVKSIADASNLGPTIGFDMGGTSTDVCRYAGSGETEIRYEMEIAANTEGHGHLHVVAPMVNVETVAAGGGSICRFDGIQLRVGPESAGAIPGPACYGRGGPLTVTDLNLLLGRICLEQFAIPLDANAAGDRIDELRKEIAEKSAKSYSREELATGLLKIANTTMAHAIQKISSERGHDTRDHAMISFGGAAAQHACAIARLLGVNRIIQHPMASLMSAWGIGHAQHRTFASHDINSDLSPKTLERSNEYFAKYKSTFAAGKNFVHRMSLELHYLGQDTSINIVLEDAEISQVKIDSAATQQKFSDEHKSLFGFTLTRKVRVRAVRFETTCIDQPLKTIFTPPSQGGNRTAETAKIFSASGWTEVGKYRRDGLAIGQKLAGPCLIVEPTTTVVVESGFFCEALQDGSLQISAESTRQTPDSTSHAEAIDPITLTLLQRSLTQIATQMGVTLQRTALSVNIKERIDFSCAVFTAEGDLLVNAPHIPVHLGSMGETIRAIKLDHKIMNPNDVFITNDPYRGGSHLPDVTVVTPVFDDAKILRYFVANRAHHAEIGGITPGSMPPFSKNLAEEGVLINSLKVDTNRVDCLQELETILTSSALPSRNPADNLGDIQAQMAANATGAKLLKKLMATTKPKVLNALTTELYEATAKRTGLALLALGLGARQFSDYVHAGLEILVAITIEKANLTDKAAGIAATATIDFTGTSARTSSNLNANRAIVRAAVMYVMRCILGEDVPLNDGLMKPITIIIPENCFLAPKPGKTAAETAAVVGGNVETSQRLVDVLLAAFGAAAASQGSMNNLIFGGKNFGYYETICGGAGATATQNGASAVHTHMTNTRITDPEVIEDRFQVRLKEFSVRKESGGRGKFSGGDGVVRVFEFLAPMSLSLLTTRRGHPPFGLNGGKPGELGKNRLFRDGTWTDLSGMAQVEVRAGDILEMSTPGGGGFGVSMIEDSLVPSSKN